MGSQNLIGVPNEEEQISKIKGDLRKLGIESANVNVCYHDDAPDTLIVILTPEQVEYLVANQGIVDSKRAPFAPQG